MVCSFAQQNQSMINVHSADEYILSKFQKYDIVILGENHWIRNYFYFNRLNFVFQKRYLYPFVCDNAAQTFGQSIHPLTFVCKV
jgi:hypothetical protein